PHLCMQIAPDLKDWFLDSLQVGIHLTRKMDAARDSCNRDRQKDSIMTRSELSIVIPCLNEDRVLPLLRQRLENVQNRPSNWELLIVSDGSTDASSRFIEAWASKDPSVKLIVLTRNFGHQSAVSAGLSFAGGDCVGIMDADLQDEPEILLDMYRT